MGVLNIPSYRTPKEKKEEEKENQYIDQKYNQSQMEIHKPWGKGLSGEEAPNPVSYTCI